MAAGGAILVDYRAVSPPYTVDAIPTATGLASCGSPEVSASDTWVTGAVTKFAKNKGKVKVSVQTNPSGAERSAQVFIGDGVFAVSQAGAACKITALSPNQGSVTGTGGEGTFTVSAIGGCSWTATVASSTSTTIDLIGYGTQSDLVGLDNVVVELSQAPEPTCLWLVSVGVATLLLRRR